MTAIAEIRNTVSKHLLLLIVLPLSVAAMLGTDLLLQWMNKGSLCSATACKTVGEHLRLGSRFLVFLGVAYFTALSAVSLVLRRSPHPAVASTALGLLFAGFAFDGAILGFQFFAVQARCPLCLGVAFALLLCGVAWSYLFRSPLVIGLCLAVWTAAFMANNLFVYPQKTPRLEEVAFLRYNAGNSEYPKYYLFFSIDCSHCLSLLNEFSARGSITGNWFLASVDRKTDALERLSFFKERNGADVEPFQGLAQITEASGHSPVSPQIRKATSNAMTYFTNAGLHGAPSLVVQEAHSRRTIILGETAIKTYVFEEKLLAR